MLYEGAEAELMAKQLSIHAIMMKHLAEMPHHFSPTAVRTTTMRKEGITANAEMKQDGTINWCVITGPMAEIVGECYISSIKKGSYYDRQVDYAVLKPTKPEAN
jgi:hypothetical protein